MSTNHWLDVPGARLYYEVQGSGPVVMLVGHPMDSAGFAAIASVLASDHTVVTYDPRGFGKSTIEDRDQDAEPDLIADDVFLVLDVVGHGPAHVFGSSGGAVTALALAVRHPSSVRTIVAHEPPLAAFLPEAEEAERGSREVYDAYRTGGAMVAWQRFMAFTGIQMRPPANAPPMDSAAAARAAARAAATSDRFFGHSLLPVTLYRPDLAALQRPSPRVVIAAGAASKGQYPQRAAVALAERLGTSVIEFPGGHAGFTTDPQAFASVLRRTLAGR
ncbi:MAG TPA: alpha/beta hydrolase [Gemmatimonadaceae bacterium]|nr:alpha/beta hydrolase [Gemmatimonadaceae bacterium]